MKNTDYISQINNSNKLELVIIIYNIILDKIILSKKLSDKLEIATNLSFIRSFLKELICTLNFDNKISEDLLSIYMYINKLIINAEIKNNLNSINSTYLVKKVLDECENLLNILLDGWKSINNNNIFKENLNYEKEQKLFAGLTYKNGKLEEFIYEDIDRGFKI